MKIVMSGTGGLKNAPERIRDYFDSPLAPWV
jgi:hypothetical protein